MSRPLVAVVTLLQPLMIENIHSATCTSVYTKAFRRFDYNFKIGTIRNLLSENTFAGHWETVFDCMENNGQQWTTIDNNGQQ